MSVSVKLGNQIYTKEKKIADLAQQVDQLTKKLAHYEEINTEFQIRAKQNEKQMYEMKKIIDLYEIEKQQAQQAKQKEQDCKEKLAQENKNQQSTVCELQAKLRELMQLTSIQKDELFETTTLNQRLKVDLQQSEAKQMNLEQQIDVLYNQRDQQLADIRTLQKSLQQKDKYISILSKEQTKENIIQKPIKKQIVNTTSVNPVSLIDNLDDDFNTMVRLKNKRRT